MFILAPDCSLLSYIIVWRVEGIEDAGENGEEPRQSSEDLIPENCLGVVGLALGEWVD